VCETALFSWGDRTCTAPEVNTVARLPELRRSRFGRMAKREAAPRCAGACDVSVSAELAADYREMVRIVDQQYCSDAAYASTCGRVTPRCLPCASACRGGVCTAVPPP
jgi:hypothetical protein